MKKEVLCILICMLVFVIAFFPVTGAMNVEKTHSNSLRPGRLQFDLFWSDNFDSYDDESSMHGQGGWKGWDNNPASTAYVTSNRFNSSPHSLEIAWFSGVSADLVHEFSGVSSGNWTFKTLQYIPNDFSGDTNFLLLNTCLHLLSM